MIENDTAYMAHAGLKKSLQNELTCETEMALNIHTAESCWKDIYNWIML